MFLQIQLSLYKCISIALRKSVKKNIIILLQGFCTLKLKLLNEQRAKKVVSDSPGLVDFAIGLVNSVFNLPDGQVMFFEEFE